MTGACAQGLRGNYGQLFAGGEHGRSWGLWLECACIPLIGDPHSAGQAESVKRKGEGQAGGSRVDSVEAGGQ